MFICTVIIVLMALCAVMEAFGIGLVYPLIRIIGNKNFLEEHDKIAGIVVHFGVTNHRRLVFFSSLCLLAFYIFKNFIILYEGKLQIAFSMKNQKDYTKRLYAYYMSRPYLYHLNTNIAIILRNINNGGSTVFSNILIKTLSIITDLITIAVIWAFLCYMDIVTALGCAFFVAPLVFAMLNYFRKKIGTYGSVQNAYFAEVNKWINQGFGSLKETKVMQKEAFFTSEFFKSYSMYTDSVTGFLFVQRLPRAIIELTTIGGILLLIAVKMLIKSDPETLIANLGVLALAAVRIMPCLNRITALFNDIKFSMPLFNEMYEDLMIVKKEKNIAEKNIIEVSKQNLVFDKEIEVRNLSFTYPGKTSGPVFTGLSFKIPKGAFVGIVGASGAGKTTFIDILLGLLPPDSGNISVDGQNIGENLSGWLNNIAYVPQSIYLVDGSIKDNIAFGIASKDVDAGQIQKVLKMAELYDFVQTLPDKEKSNVGDKGAKLSGGQRQRIGIARALYHNPKVLILDEATSALDNETERQITDTILKLKGSITIIAIAHRLSTLEHCDFKIEFDKGNAKVLR